MDEAQVLYEQALNRGVAKEVARFVLPLATPTKLYMTGSVRSWIHYLAARLDPSTQQEHRQVAIAISELFDEEFPVVSEACGIVKKVIDDWNAQA
jgi:thymidylate synthase (FAD)